MYVYVEVTKVDRNILNDDFIRDIQILSTKIKLSCYTLYKIYHLPIITSFALIPYRCTSIPSALI